MFRVIHSLLLVVTLSLIATPILAQENSVRNSSQKQLVAARTLIAAKKFDEGAPVRNVAILIHEGVELLDFAGPGEVFSIARDENGKRAFNVYTVASSEEPITSQQFVKVTPNFKFSNCPKPDIIVLPGGATTNAMGDKAVMKWVTETVPKTEVTFSVCTGAFLLGKAGLLDGEKATTHWNAIEGMKIQFPNIDVVEGIRFVDNGKIMTTAGVSAGIDGSLYLVKKLLGEKSSIEAAKYMEYVSGNQPAEASIQNGIYLVNRWTETKDDLFPLMSGEELVEHNPASLEADSTEPVKYITVVPGNSVLFNHLKTVDPVKQNDGRINLKLTMNQDSAKELERLSQQHLGRQVAIVIDGTAVTLHKIRGIISDGKLQISRCTDDGCSVILKELVGK